jgi:hypothetical protein
MCGPQTTMAKRSVTDERTAILSETNFNEKLCFPEAAFTLVGTVIDRWVDRVLRFPF